GRIDGDIREQKPAGFGILLAVAEINGDRRRLLSELADTAAIEAILQPQQIVRGLDDIDVDRIERLNRRQGSHLTLANQCPFGHQGSADTTGDGRLDRGITEIELGALERRAGLRHLGFGLTTPGHHFIVVVLADGRALDQRSVTLLQQFRLVQFRLGELQIGARFAHVCLKWRSEEHTSELQSRENLVCRLLLEKKKLPNRNRCPATSPLIPLAGISENSSMVNCALPGILRAISILNGWIDDAVSAFIYVHCSGG